MPLNMGYFAAGAAGGPLLDSIMYIDSKTRSSQGTSSQSLATFPHIAGLQRVLIVQGTGLRTDTSSCLYTSLVLNGGAGTDKGFRRVDSNVGGAAAAVTVWLLNTGTTSVNITGAGGTSHVCYASHGMYIAEGVDVSIADYKFAGGSQSTYNIDLISDPLKECYSFLCPCVRENNVGFGTSTGFQEDAQVTHTSNGKTLLGHTPEIQEGTNNKAQVFTNVSRALLSGTVVGLARI